VAHSGEKVALCFTRRLCLSPRPLRLSPRTFNTRSFGIGLSPLRLSPRTFNTRSFGIGLSPLRLYPSFLGGLHSNQFLLEQLSNIECWRRDPKECSKPDKGWRYQKPSSLALDA